MFNPLKRRYLITLMIVVILSLAACSSEETDPNQITDIVWQWERVIVQGSGDTTTVDKPENYTLVFMEDGTFSGTADCNQIAGTYSQEGGFSLMMGPSTMAFCGEESMDTLFLELLGNVVAGGPDGAGGFALENAGGEKRMEFSNGGAG